MEGQVKVYEHGCLAMGIEDLLKLWRSVNEIKCIENGYVVPSPVSSSIILSYLSFIAYLDITAAILM